MVKGYDFSRIEKKWQKKWEQEKAFIVNEKKGKEKYYVLDMFPYPSGEGLHIGHAFVFSLGDIHARFQRMLGKNVLYPIGYDSLGLPAENAAIQAGSHPEEYTKKSVANFMKQQKAMGWSYDWSRVVKTSDPEYYKWDQWIFLKMLEKGLAYRKKASVNYCSKCDTVLANEQVVQGCCWRHEDTAVQIKPLEQWFFQITRYADELLKGHDNLDWPERAKTLQRNWIGKSEGTEIVFSVGDKSWPVFTTRPDTLMGVTFLVVSAQHPELNSLVSEEQKGEVEKFLKKLNSVSEKDIGAMDKEGVFTGSYAEHPLTGDPIPVWTGNFVVAEYGSGMVMAVPAHDQRDYEFAKKYGLEVKQVISAHESDEPSGPQKGGLSEGDIGDGAYTGEGVLVNSEGFDGLASREAREHITNALKMKKKGKKTVQYKLRDWLISRQRYWGTPIPIVYCDACGVVPVPEKDLPVELPKDVKFGKGNPLETSKSFVHVDCPRCGKPGRRETDTMDTFVNSSWYFLRYADPKNNKNIFDSKKANYWAPVDQYIGGPEHITMHLIYIRFYTKFLRDLGLLNFDEPALKYFTQGIVKGADGEKMSKSRGNVVEPLEMIKTYGADALRLYLVSNSSPDRDFDWDEKSIKSSYKFVRQVYEYFSSLQSRKVSARMESKLHQAVQSVTADVEGFRHNLAVIKIRQLFSVLSQGEVDLKTARTFVQLLHVYCPFVTEELWEKLGGKGFVSLSKWPEVDEKKIDQKLERAEASSERTVKDILHVMELVKEKSGKDVGEVHVYVVPGEVKGFDAAVLSERVGADVKVWSVSDKKKVDPEGKSKKAKPGKPGIWVR